MISLMRRESTVARRAGALVLLALLAQGIALGDALASARIFWTTRANNTVSWSTLDGTGAGDLSTGLATVDLPWGTAVDAGAGKIYWANRQGNRISWARLDGSDAGDLQTGAATVSGPAGVAVDPVARRIYWANRDGNKISWASLDVVDGGDLPTTGATALNGPTGVAVDPVTAKIYWANFFGNTISFARLDGGGGGDIATGSATVNGAAGVAVDPATGRIYWANLSGNKISVAKLDGSGGADIATGTATVNVPVGVAVDPAAGRLYWGNLGGNTVSFARLDGSGGADLVTTGANSHNASFPALVIEPVAQSPPVVTGDLTTPTTLSCSTGAWLADLVPAFLGRAPAGYAYRWLTETGPITGATASSYAVTDPGRYRCQVTALNIAGDATQVSAPVTVSAPATVTAPPASPPSTTVTASMPKPPSKPRLLSISVAQRTFSARRIGRSWQITVTSTRGVKALKALLLDTHRKTVGTAHRATLKGRARLTIRLVRRLTAGAYTLTFTGLDAATGMSASRTVRVKLR